MVWCETHSRTTKRNKVYNFFHYYLTERTKSRSIIGKIQVTTKSENYQQRKIEILWNTKMPLFQTLSILWAQFFFCLYSLTRYICNYSYCLHKSNFNIITTCFLYCFQLIFKSATVVPLNFLKLFLWENFVSFWGVFPYIQPHLT